MYVKLGGFELGPRPCTHLGDGNAALDGRAAVDVDAEGWEDRAAAGLRRGQEVGAMSFRSMRRGRLVGLGLSALVAVALGGSGAAAAGGGGVGAITEYALPSGSGNLSAIGFGADGRLWFPESFHDQVGAVSTKGVITSYPIASGSGVYGIVMGPDGSLWLPEHDGRKIGVMSTSGTLLTEYPQPSAQPFDISGGPDGSLWWTDEQVSPSKIDKITTGGADTPYTGATSFAHQIRAGADGNLWFSENVNGNNSKLGRITTSGTVTEFPLANALAAPLGVAAGPDGNIWFTEACNCANMIGKITPSGAITEYPVPTANAGPQYIAAGPDGNLWFTEEAGNKVGRITPSGTITEFTIPTPNADAVGITIGPDGNMWFLEGGAHKVARISVADKNTSYALVTDAGVIAKAIKLKKQGISVEWVFEGPAVHTVTDSSGMGLFDSGDHGIVSYYSFAFSAAGTYAFHDTHNGQIKGTVSVPIAATASGSQATVTWSSAAPPSGYVFDVQLAQPGSKTFLDWKTSQTATSASFGPGDPLYVGAGKYQFRARLRNTGNGNASGYSAGKAVTLS
jgi:streptogramin lyase